MTDTARQAQDKAGDARSTIARLGLVGKGLLYTLIGVLAISIALGDRDSATKDGAIQALAQAPLGKFLLIGLSVALVALVAWKALQAIAGDPVEGSEASDRAKNAVKAVTYGGSAATAVTILIANWSGSSSSGSGGGSGGSSEQKAASVVMDAPGGRWIVMAVGVGIIGYAGYQVYKHVVNSEFMERLRVDDDTHGTVEAAGRVGYGGRAAVMAGVGVFFFLAGVNHDPDKAKGLSGVLTDLAGSGWGQVALWAIAIALLVYGLFTLAEAKYRRAT